MRGWILLLAILLVPFVTADVLIINSQDWRDVYTGLQHSVSTNQDAYFAVDQAQATALLGIIRPEQQITLLTGQQQQVPGLRSLLQANGYVITDIQSANALQTNQDLALIADTQNLVIIDPSYPYNAISVATYANMRNASVVFAQTNLELLVEEKQPEEVLIYGIINREQYDIASSLSTVEINTQDKFSDNFALVQRFIQYQETQGLLLSNGEFIENQLVTGKTPTLFIGRQNVPQEVTTFISENNFRIGTLIGNALAVNAEQIKDATGISIFIKFAQGRNQQQLPLDIFPLPTPQAQISIVQAEYNPALQALFVTYQNPGEVATYFSASITTSQGTVEDDQPIFIDAQSTKTTRYDIASPQGEATITLVYGLGPSSLEFILQEAVRVSEIIVEDASTISFPQNVRYDGTSLLVDITNTGSRTTHVILEAVDVLSGSQRLRIGSEVTSIRSQATQTIRLPVTLTEQDIQRNPTVHLEAYFGQREVSLVHVQEATLPLVLKEAFTYLWLLLGAVILVVVFVLVRKKR